MAFALPALASVPGFLLKNWKWIGIGLLVLAVGIQTARLNHAKADQLDHRSCVHGQPCKPLKWEAEARADEATIAEQAKQLKAATQSIANLEQGIAQQNAAVAAQSAAGARALADANAALTAQRKALATAQSRAAALARPIAGTEPCARSADFDRTFVESLK